LQQWMSDQVGIRGLVRQLRKEGPLWTSTLPQLPRLIHRALENDPSDRLSAIEKAIDRVNRTQRFQSGVLLAIVALGVLIGALYAYLLLSYGS
jgi:ubiquinone biosynthesis protein